MERVLNTSAMITPSPGAETRRGRKLAALTIVFCLLSIVVFGQKMIVIKDYPDKDMKVYNLNGAELYIQIDDSNHYVPKIAAFEYRTTRYIDSLIEYSRKRDVSILIRNARYDFIITIGRATYLEHQSYEVYTYTQNKKDGYIIILTDTHSWALNSQILEIKPNKRWRSKYLHKPPVRRSL